MVEAAKVTLLQSETRTFASMVPRPEARSYPVAALYSGGGAGADLTLDRRAEIGIGDGDGVGDRDAVGGVIRRLWPKRRRGQSWCRVVTSWKAAGNCAASG